MVFIEGWGYLGNVPKHDHEREIGNHSDNFRNNLYAFIFPSNKIRGRFLHLLYILLSYAAFSVECMTCFTSTVADKQPILIKINAEDVKAYVGKIPQNIPNVYVLNKKGYEQEVKWAIQKMLQIYNIHPSVNADGE